MSVPRPSAGLVLLACTCVWASTFAVTKELVATAPPLLYLTLRFGAAALLLTPLLLWRRASLRSPGFLRDSLVLGLLNASGLVFQVLGQVYTTASKSAFITSLNTPLTALVGLLVYRIVPTMGQRVAVALASFGLVLLTWPQLTATAPYLAGAMAIFGGLSGMLSHTARTWYASSSAHRLLDI